MLILTHRSERWSKWQAPKNDNFALNISSSSATVSELSLNRPQDFVVTVLHQPPSKRVRPSEPFDHEVNVMDWIQPQLECNVHQYAPHYFDFCWFKVVEPEDAAVIPALLSILKPKYWTLIDCSAEGLQLELLKFTDVYTKHNTSQSSEGCLQIFTTMPMGKRCTGKIIASKTTAALVQVVIEEYFNTLKNLTTTKTECQEDKHQDIA